MGKMVVEMTSTFETWARTRSPEGQRKGKHLFNTAPDHIRAFVRTVWELDPFYVDSPETMYILNNFLLFASLVWNVTDEKEMQEACRFVMSEPNARR